MDGLIGHLWYNWLYDNRNRSNAPKMPLNTTISTNTVLIYLRKQILKHSWNKVSVVYLLTSFNFTCGNVLKACFWKYISWNSEFMLSPFDPKWYVRETSGITHSLVFITVGRRSHISQSQSCVMKIVELQIERIWSQTAGMNVNIR